MKKWTIIGNAVLLALALVLLGGCSSSSSQTGTSFGGVQISEKETEEETQSEEETTTAAPLETTEEETEPETEAELGFSFAELSGLTFYFASGAGGWGTELVIYEDGSFEGWYHDSEMGELDLELYPNGSYYWCDFSGKIADLPQIVEYTYSVTVSYIQQEAVSGEEEIVDGIRYIASEPLGMTGDGEILIYLPGVLLSELPEEYVSWAHGTYILTGDTLPCYGLYNVSEEYGFTSY